MWASSVPWSYCDHFVRNHWDLGIKEKLPKGTFCREEYHSSLEIVTEGWGVVAQHVQGPELHLQDNLKKKGEKIETKEVLRKLASGPQEGRGVAYCQEVCRKRQWCLQYSHNSILPVLEYRPHRNPVLSISYQYGYLYFINEKQTWEVER